MLKVKNLNAGYGHKTVISDAEFEINNGEIISIVGPNGCGKSTLLKTIAGHLEVMGGSIVIDNKELSSYSLKSLAKKIGCLNQANLSPNDMTVERLVYFGRIPYHRFGISKTPEQDRKAVALAMESTGVLPYRHRTLSTLSGGERQRVWIALALAQEPDYLLLDEPTTYLDICYQLEVLELLRHLNAEHNITIVMVLHDLNQAVKYSNRIIMMRQGSVYKFGTPDEVITQQSLKDVFSLECDIINDNSNNMVIIPTGFSDNSFLRFLGEVENER